MMKYKERIALLLEKYSTKNDKNPFIEVQTYIDDFDAAVA